jgi:two-component system nitrogen regulation response regulator GlnG
MYKTLVIDDERNIRFSIAEVFSDTNIEILEAATGDEGLRHLEEANPDAILLDMRLGGESGLDVFQRIREVDPKALVIFITGFGAAEAAIEAMKPGAYDYVVKPLDAAHLRDVVKQACEIRRLVRVPAFVDEDDRPEGHPERLIGSGPAMRGVCKLIGRVAPQEVNVLILGESGTGKELVARAIYHHSKRGNGPFLAINCAAIPESLLESEMFGHERGAFTGAHQRRIGKFEQCDGGTLLLDEIGDMALTTQAKILRLVQELRFERVGGSESIQSDVRIIAATNQPLDQMIEEGQFRRDLYYRLRGVTIPLPPLRERREDIPELAHHFLFRFNGEVGRSVHSIAPEALELLTNYDWPGNVRELQNVIRLALIASSGTALLPSFLPPEILAARSGSAPAEQGDDDGWARLPEQIERWLAAGERDIYRRALEDVDRLVLGQVLAATGGNQARAAELLGLSRITVRSKTRSWHGGVSPKKRKL